MIKRILTLGIMGTILAGGAAVGVTSVTNHQKTSNHIVLSRAVKTKNSKETIPQPATLISSTALPNYNSPTGSWNFGVSNYADLTSGTAYSNLTANSGIIGCAGVENGYGQTAYGQIANVNGNSRFSDASIANVPGPNTFEAGIQSGYGTGVTWYNNVNNGPGIQQQSTYPASDYE